jgi:5-methylcytosine-specific restriction protein A
MPNLPPVHRPRWSKKRASELAKRRSKRRLYPTNSATWRKIRAAQLAREPLCRECHKQGKLTSANTVDHVDGDSFNNQSVNLQSLCASCHGRLTVHHDGGFGNPVRRRNSDEGG